MGSSDQAFIYYLLKEMTFQKVADNKFIPGQKANSSFELVSRLLQGRVNYPEG